MIKPATQPIFDILDSLPQNAKVIDVGGAYSPFRRANALIDIISYENVKRENAKGNGEVRLTKENYFQHDICNRTPWPIADKTFDYSTCSHVLEDIRDPLWVCSEIMRISKAGYIEIPSRLYETSFGLESRKFAGASHHRWLVDLFEGKLRFTFKHFYVHSKAVNKNRTRPDLKNEDMYLKLEWNDHFEYTEQWLGNGKEVFEYFLARKITEKEMWRIYRINSPKNIILRWLAYFKNTSPLIQKFYKKIK